MLYLRAKNTYRLEKSDHAIFDPKAVFGSRANDSWLENDFARRLIREVDHIEIPDGVSTLDAIDNAKLNVLDLCTGTINNLVAHFHDTSTYRIMLVKMGPNCYKYLCETAREKDVYAIAGAGWYPTDDDLQGLQVLCEDLDVLCTNNYELVRAMDTLWAEGYFDYERRV